MKELFQKQKKGYHQIMRIKQELIKGQKNFDLKAEKDLTMLSCQWDTVLFSGSLLTFKAGYFQTYDLDAL